MGIFNLKEKRKNYFGNINIQSNIPIIRWLQILIVSLVFVNCSSKNSHQNYKVHIYQTSSTGDRLKSISFDKDKTPVSEENKVAMRLLPDHSSRLA